MATLRGTGVPATFFLTGDFVAAYPTLARHLAAEYPIGNHTQTHPDLTTLTNTRVVDEIRGGAASIMRVTGTDTHPYFRFPFGARDARTIALVNDECYVAFRWTVDSLGWKGTSGGMSTSAVRDRVVAALRPGAIVLMHVGANPEDGTTLDAAALPAIIAEAKARGYAFVTLEEAFR
jgi:peptidoglycan/xylan/chitin deacetylase (PgdA/CDA1 family)